MKMKISQFNVTTQPPELFPNAFTNFNFKRQLYSLFSIFVNFLISFIEIPDKNKIIRQIYPLSAVTHALHVVDIKYN